MHRTQRWVIPKKGDPVYHAQRWIISNKEGPVYCAYRWVSANTLCFSLVLRVELQSKPTIW